MKTSNLIKEFLMQKRFAMVGVSRDPRDFSRRMFKELLQRGYDVIPVNPNLKEMEGKVCFAHIQDIRPPLTSALLMTPRSMTDQILRDCVDAGMTLVWIYGISGTRDVSPNALKICEEHGIALVPGYCPYMFMPMAALFHRMHGFAWKVIGRYPS